MRITRLTQADAVPYRALMMRGYALHPDAFTSSVTEREVLPLSWWQGRLDPAHGHEAVFGAWVQDQLAGACGLSFETRDKVRHKATLFGMYVDSDFRRRGIGAQLVQATLAFARSRTGIRIVQLTVTQGNLNAQSLYERYGFVSFGVEPMAVAVGDGYVSKIHMACDLVDPNPLQCGDGT